MGALKYNTLVTYNRKRWRVIGKNKYVGYDLATIENGKTIIKKRIPANKINKVK